MKKLRDYQENIANNGIEILNKNNIVYLSMAVRLGKTLTALEIAKLHGAKKVLFITKKMAFKSIEDDYNDFGYSSQFSLTIINKESIKKIDSNGIDLVVIDEAHEFGAFPKTGAYQKQIRLEYSSLPMIMLSGTPHPESFCQLYHQLDLSKYSPWRLYKNFYAWYKDYGLPKTKYLGHHQATDYSDCRKDVVLADVAHLFLSYTQEEAGFTTTVNVKKVYHEMSDLTNKLICQLRDDKIIQGKEKVIIADSGSKMMSKIHQISSGTIKFDDGSSTVLDYSKAYFVQQYFAGYKIAIFYYFQEELNALREVFGDTLTTDLEEFNTTDKHFAVQQARGAKGISLKMADKLVFYNFGFSNEKYIQAIDRLTTMDRLSNDVYFVINPKGIDNYVFKAIESKKDYILSAFKKDIKNVGK